MAAIDQAARREGAPLAAVNQREVDTLMRRFFDQSRAPQDESTPADGSPAKAHEAPPRRDFDMASGLLDRAAQAFDLLIDRCQKLEHDLEQANERAAAQAAEQGDVIEQWKRLASGLKAQFDIAEEASSALKQRCDAAEARTAMAEQRASALDRASALAAGHAASAESLSTKLHDKVVSAFGIGSRAHPVLEAVATRATPG